MSQTEINISGRCCHIISTCDHPTAVIIKPLGEFERLLLMDECQLITGLTAETFTMIAFEVTEKDLRPEGAEDTFLYLRDEILPYVKQHFPDTNIIIGGYSLGGLFALWSATRLDCIDAVFAGSPSLWMDGWDKYAEANPVKARFVYMSLGDKEEATRKMPYHIIGDRVRQQHQLHLRQLGESNCTLEWNSGGHFADIEQRKARGFAWCLNKLRKMETAE